jgi:hypothetical protein
MTRKQQETPITDEAKAILRGMERDGTRGKRSNTGSLKKLAVKLRMAGLDAEQIMASLLAYNQRSSSPPIPETELADIVAWVMAQQFGANGRDPAAVPELVGVDGETIYNQQIEDLQPVVKGFLYPGLTLFNARPKIGKSWLMLQSAIGVACEATVAGSLRVCRPGKVLYLALEDSEARTTRRMRKLTPPDDSLCNVTFIYRKDIEPAANGGIVQIEQYLKSHEGTRLVVIDTLLAFQRIERKKTNDLLLSDYNPALTRDRGEVRRRHRGRGSQPQDGRQRDRRR